MKKVILISLCITTLAGCVTNEPLREITKPTSIEGLELTFLESSLKGSFRSIYFHDEQTGYIAGFDGALYKTVDGGHSWSAKNTNTLLTLYDIHFLNTSEGFIVGGNSACSGTGCVPEGALILHTIDGGETWTRIPVELSEKVELRSISFVNESTGFAVGGGVILSTHDGGASWAEKRINNLGGIMMEGKFLDDKNGLITCTFGKLIRTTDGGQNWTVSNPFPATGPNTLTWVDQNLVVSAGYTKIHRSTDAGATWTELVDYPSNTLKILATTDDVVFAFGSGVYSGGEFGHSSGSIYFTTDGGQSWTGSNTVHEIRSIQMASFPSGDIGYAIAGSALVKIKIL